MAWAEMPPSAAGAGHIVQGSAAPADFAGAVTRRAFAAREMLVSDALVKPGDPQFLVDALAPDRRAVSIAVDATQSTSGLAAPGDHVDIVLTQTFTGDKIDAAHRSVAETVLRDLRLIAVDQSLTAPDKAAAGSDPKLPKTVTLEVTDKQAETLLVAEQLGRVQLVLRGEQGDADTIPFAGLAAAPTWAFNVSAALRVPPAEKAPLPRRSIQVLRGGKLDHLCWTDIGLAICP
jgi:pilus assembly protein CpaB